ncbi:profilin [Phanerochaete sordida]|uniref:Profilin n=1 Tax=Phanerochaete sordida TaxID=48140 RepID=A0A9P3GP15_9APHY|nr:profilin [Phanerochaete sordida]
MSWQAYVDTNLVGTGKVAQAAILGQQGGVWAQSAGFNLSADEQKAVVGAHANIDTVRASGIRLNGKKYFTLNADENSIQGKMGGDGCIIVKTKQAILVAVYTAPTQQVEANLIVQGLADYLIGVGY